MEGMIGEIRLFAGNFAPKNWAYCAGQIINIASNTALFSILGTTYGGNGTTTFALPDLMGRTPVGAGNGPGLSPYSLGQKTGEEGHTLLTSEMPMHTHSATMVASSGVPTANGPAGGALGKASRSIPMPTMFTDTLSSPPISMGNGSAQLGIAGGSQSHENRQPYLAVNYVICQFGIFPSRN